MYGEVRECLIELSRGRIRGGAGYQQGYVTDQETQGQ